MSRDLRLIAVPYDSGIRDWRMGAGPARLLESGWEAHLRARGHTVQTRWIDVPADPPPAEIRTAFELATAVADAVRQAGAEGALPVILAGNCITAVGTLAGMETPNPGVLWLDAHGDFNTPESTASGFLDGMALAVATGRCWVRMASGIPGFLPVPESHAVLIGTRDLDPGELVRLDASACRVLTSYDDPREMNDALDALRARTKTVYLHVDLDVLDPDVARANAFAAPGGLLPAHLLGLMMAVRRRFTIGAVAFTAYDPSCDPDARVCAAARTILDFVLE